jgi:hypothetical protein
MHVIESRFRPLVSSIYSHAKYYIWLKIPIQLENQIRKLSEKITWFLTPKKATNLMQILARSSQLKIDPIRDVYQLTVTKALNQPPQ